MPKRAAKQLGIVKIVLGRRTETKQVAAATFSVCHVHGKHLWSFDVETEDGDGSLTVNWAEHALSKEDLVGTTVVVPSGYDRKAERHVASVYYCEHNELNYSRIKIVAREAKKYRIRWIAESPELARFARVNRCRIAVDAPFRFEGIEEVSDQPVRLLLQHPHELQREYEAESLWMNGYVVKPVATLDAARMELTRPNTPLGLAVCWWPTSRQALALVRKTRRAGYSGGFLFVLSKWDQVTLGQLGAAGAQYLLPDEPNDGIDSARVDDAIRKFVP